VTGVGEEVRCARPGCGHGYGAHAIRQCSVVLTGVDWEQCTCRGFLWVPPVKPAAEQLSWQPGQ
jgi:hypothetical protein